MTMKRNRFGWAIWATCFVFSISAIAAEVAFAEQKNREESVTPISTRAALEMLRGDDIAARELAAESLAVHAEAGDIVAIEALIGLLDDSPSKVRYHAEWGLARTGSPAVEPLRKAFAREAKDERRARIAQALGKMGIVARSAAPDMISALDDPHSRTAPRAAYALGAMRAREALPALVRTYAAMRKIPSQREVARAIDAIGSDQSARASRTRLVDSLVADLGSSDDRIRRETIVYVVELLRVVHRDAPAVLPAGEELAVVVPLLERALDDPDADTLAIVRGLGHAGGDAAAAIPRLEALAKDPAFAREAERALAAIGTADAQRVLAERAALAALEKRIRQEYSLLDHQGRMRLLPFYVTGKGANGVQMEVRFLYIGNEVRRPTHVVVAFLSYSPEARLADLSVVDWKADGRRIAMRNIDRSLGSSAQGVIENVSAILTVEEFQTLANANRVEARLSSVEFSLGPKNRAALRHFAGKIPAIAPAAANTTP